MQTFRFRKANSVEQALTLGSVSGGAASQTRFIAGGTTLVDLMKLNVERPQTVIDINGLPLDRVEELAQGGLRIGALVSNSALAHHPRVLKDYSVLSQALLSGASPQLRNMATTGGNLMQRTRCPYFRDVSYGCNKREPGSGCSAIGGYHRMLAILGTSDSCIATNPSDMNVALVALDATVRMQRGGAVRAVPIVDFHLLPGGTPDRETVVKPGELITSVTLPAPRVGMRSHYLKLRDRAAYEFALASTAVVLTMQNGVMRNVRIALGGVGTKPWHAPEAAKALEGRPPSVEAFEMAAKEAVRQAKPLPQNAFKVNLLRRCLVRALTQVTQNTQAT